MLPQDLKHNSISTVNSTCKEIKYAFKMEIRLRMKWGTKCLEQNVEKPQIKLNRYKSSLLSHTEWNKIYTKAMECKKPQNK